MLCDCNSGFWLCPQAGHSVLIFVAKREDCAKAAAQVTSCISIPERNAGPQAQLDPGIAQGAGDTDMPTTSAAQAAARSSSMRLTRADVQQKLRELIAGLKLGGDRELCELVRLVGAGAGCHHAGLPKEVKELISTAFSTGDDWQGPVVVLPAPVLGLWGGLCVSTLIVHAPGQHLGLSQHSYGAPITIQAHLCCRPIPSSLC